MSKIIGFVKKIAGVYKAESKDGKIRVLKPNAPIYEDDAVFAESATGEKYSGNNNLSDLAIQETFKNYTRYDRYSRYFNR